jgi:ATP-dependent exoDNAse (exonuclease V) alpha subunit
MKQDQALQIMQMGFNSFLTGQAGAGKTYTLNKFIKWCREHRINAAVTASTGIAATHIGGTTIHSWSGIGIKDELTQKDLEKIAKRKEVQKRFDSTKVLIIDEISMLSANFFDNLNLVCKYVRANQQPFGGLQIILCGDLFQLPPINRSSRKLQMVVHSEAWSELKPVICYLKEQHRQEAGDKLNLILNNIRAGQAKEQDLQILNTKVEQASGTSFEQSPENLIPTKLYSHNQDVDYINLRELEKLSTREETYQTDKAGKRALVESLLKSCLAPEELKLKIDSEVMFVKNDISGRYSNGTRGKIVNFTKDGKLPIVQTIDERIIVAEQGSWSIQDEKGQDLASISQVPLRLAWAITIHKSQGMSLDSAFIDLGKVFEYGMGYVALSRVRTLEGLHLGDFNEMSLKINPQIIQINQKLSDHSDLTAERFSKLKPAKIKKNIEESILKKRGIIEAQKIEQQDIPKKAAGGKGQKGSHKTSIKMLLDGQTLKKVAEERGVKTQTVISHLARHFKEVDSTEKKQDLLKFKALKPPTKNIKAVKGVLKVLSKNKEFDASSRFAVIQIHKELSKSNLNLSYEEIHLALIWAN